jgi:hypothetical protein
LVALAWGLVFFVGLTLGISLHFNLPAVRSLAAVSLSHLLSETFRGEVRVEDIRLNSLRSFEVPRVVVSDETGRLVLDLQGIRAHVRVIRVLGQVVRGDSTIDIIAPHVRVEKAHANIEFDRDSGQVTIARAFTLAPKPPKPKSDETKTEVAVWLQSIELGHGTVSAPDLGGRAMKARVDLAQGDVRVSEDGVRVTVDRFG